MKKIKHNNNVILQITTAIVNDVYNEAQIVL